MEAYRWAFTAFILLALLPGRLAAVIEDATFWHRAGVEDLRRSLNKERIEGPAKNVIIFVGDGMGVITHTMSRIYKGQKLSSTGEEEELAWERFPYSGLIKTYNTDHQVSDSAGTATAILSGVKTSLGVLGVDSTVKYNSCDTTAIERGRLDTVMDWAHSTGKLAGVVTTARLTHATPGALYAKSPMRDWECDTDIPEVHSSCEDIASQLVNQVEKGKLTVALGGGLSKFKTMKNGGSRSDEDLVDYLKSKGIKVVTNTGELQEWDYTGQLVGLFGNSHMSYEVERDTTDIGQPSLSEMTRQGINRLSRSEKGYVLLVEAGRIDHAHHENRAKFAMEETLELENAVNAALEMVDIEETLVLVTADHSHAVTMSGYPTRGNNILGYVYDPAKNAFMLGQDNQSQPYQTISYANGPGHRDHFDDASGTWRDLSQMDFTSNLYKQPAMFYLPYETHGGEDVAVYARGPQAHLVTGLHEQSFIGVLAGYAGCINKNRFGCPPAPTSTSAAATSSFPAVRSHFLLFMVFLIRTNC